MKRFAILAATCISCQSKPPEVEHPPIPPQVFEQVCCWISDTEQPVMTEINLDAVEQNRNQFFEGCARDGEWVRWNRPDNEGFAQYRFLCDENGHQMVEYQNNGGGSLTTARRIGFSILTRTVLKDGRPKKIRVLRVESIADVAQPEKFAHPSH